MIIRADSGATFPLADRSVQCIVTSPPYWGLRDYGVEGQIGSERTVQEFVERMVSVFREARRALKDDGVLWLNMGDCYNSGAKGPRTASQSGKHGYWENEALKQRIDVEGLAPKQLLGLPWRVAFALQADGWWLRDCVIWHKPNPMPESVTDRTTKAHEYIFLLTKAERYYYDHEAIKERATWLEANPGGGSGVGFGRLDEAMPGRELRDPKRRDKQRGHSRRHAGFSDRWDGMSVKEQGAMGRNKRSVWTVACRPALDGDGDGEKHFAAYPPELIVPCILAGSRPGDVVLDPFAGTGTTVYTAEKYGRRGVGLELNPAYARVARANCARSEVKQGLLAGVGP